jgi:transcription termination factor Rho
MGASRCPTRPDADHPNPNEGEVDMSVLERSELLASPLADLHAIADQLGLEGFRRLRKADLIDAILGQPATPSEDSTQTDTPAREERDGGSSTRRRRSSRTRRPKASASDQDAGSAAAETPSPRGDEPAGKPEHEKRASTKDTEEERLAEGVVELLGNGSAFLRINPPEASDDDVYISAAQVRRCELVSGDRVTGPVRRPRRSERYPSLVRIEKINGNSAESVSEGPRFEDLPAAYPSKLLPLDPQDPTLKAIETLTPIGLGSRALIIGAPGSGKTETLRRIQAALSEAEDLEVSLVLVGARPEEITASQDGTLTPSSTLSFAASADSQGKAVERAIDAAKRVAARGSHALVLIDTLDGLDPHAARRALVSARNLADGGSLTVIATASRAFGGETTVIALDVRLAGVGSWPALDLAASTTLKADLLVGEDGVKAITKARAAAG